jgi:hypothetical protein
MPLISCPDCKTAISDTASTCPKCGYQVTPEKIAEIKKEEAKFVVGCFTKIVKVSVVLTGIILLIYVFSEMSEFFQPDGVAICTSACKNDKSLTSITRFVSYDPVDICKSQCKKTGGYCPAEDGSGNQYTGCFVCGASGGKINCY